MSLEQIVLTALAGLVTLVVSLIAFIVSDWRGRLARLEERVESVRNRTEGLSSDYGPRLKALEERARE